MPSTSTHHGHMSHFPYTTVSAFFEAEGDFQENLEDESTFLPGQPVMSQRTGMQYVVERYDEDTLDGQQVVIVRSTEVEDQVFPILASDIVPNPLVETRPMPPWVEGP